MSEDDHFLSLDDEEAPAVAAAEQSNNAAAALIHLRANAYRRLFREGSATAEDVQTVMDDLTAFCRGFESTYHPDTNKQLHLEGRREVWLRILEQSRVPTDMIFDRFQQRVKG